MQSEDEAKVEGVSWWEIVLCALVLPLVDFLGAPLPRWLPTSGSCIPAAQGHNSDPARMETRRCPFFATFTTAA